MSIKSVAIAAVLVLAACSSDPTPSATMDGHGHMAHSPFEVPAAGAPTVDIVVTEDAIAGFNIHIETTNFTWAPENVNTAPVAGEGHAHLYIDGEKIARLYGPDYHVGPGVDATLTSHFRVTLNANDHSDYAVDGVVIADETHTAEAPEEHTH